MSRTTCPSRTHFELANPADGVAFPLAVASISNRLVTTLPKAPGGTTRLVSVLVCDAYGGCAAASRRPRRQASPAHRPIGRMLAGLAISLLERARRYGAPRRGHARHQPARGGMRRAQRGGRRRPNDQLSQDPATWLHASLLDAQVRGIVSPLLRLPAPDGLILFPPPSPEAPPPPAQPSPLPAATATSTL